MAKKAIKKDKPDIPARLLWEFDYDTFNFDNSYKIVIERVLEMGNLHEWREIVRYYTKKQILETIDWSAQLTKRDKQFSRLFLNSDIVKVGFYWSKWADSTSHIAAA